MNMILSVFLQTLLVVGLGMLAFWLFNNRGKFLKKLLGQKLSKSTKDIIVSVLIISLFFLMMYLSGH